jgi:hypothetical protein
MRTILILASSALAAATLAAGLASADDLTNVTPPITREHAQTIRAVHPAGELTVTPQPVFSAPETRRLSTAAARIELADR